MQNKPSAAQSPEIQAKLESYTPAQQAALLQLRDLIFDAAQQQSIALIETLKWNQLAFLPRQANIGTTIRIDMAKSGAAPTVYFHCQTTLVDTFRQLYPHSFGFEGNRALHLAANQPLPVEELRHCFGLALTYHSAKRK